MIVPKAPPDLLPADAPLEEYERAARQAGVDLGQRALRGGEITLADLPEGLPEGLRAPGFEGGLGLARERRARLRGKRKNHEF